ncbi:MAG: phosphatidate cytidylyltransferase [Bacteroidetes bacterium]|nr:phosphatidate cytidylyltransferase [Bacteroidota bacterium]
MSNILVRALTGFIFILTVAGSAILDFRLFLLFFGAYTFLALREFYKLISNTDTKPLIAVGIIIGIGIYLISALSVLSIITTRQGGIFYIFTFVISASIFLIELYRHSKTPYFNIAYTFLGVIYIAIPFSMLISFSEFQKEYSTFSYQILGYFFILWMYDTFAYLCGMKFGKHRLFERISPKKTWEGVIGGALFAFITAYIISLYFLPNSLLHWSIITVIVVVFGTFGDLVESMFKRSLDKKDSGTILPGHGGILDRFDAVFLSAPVVYLYLKILAFI